MGTQRNQSRLEEHVVVYSGGDRWRACEQERRRLAVLIMVEAKRIEMLAHECEMLANNNRILDSGLNGVVESAKSYALVKLGHWIAKRSEKWAQLWAK